MKTTPMKKAEQWLQDVNAPMSYDIRKRYLRVALEEQAKQIFEDMNNFVIGYFKTKKDCNTYERIKEKWCKQ